MLYFLLYILIGIVGCIVIRIGIQKRDVTLDLLFSTTFLWPLMAAMFLIDSAEDLVIIKAEWFWREKW